MPILETRNLSKHFGGLIAVNQVSYTVEAGELRSIIGPNGAGKTTFFNMIAGDLDATEGNVFFKGEDVTALSTFERSHKGIGRTYQITNIFPKLSVLENVRIAAQSRKTTFNLWSGVNDHKELIEKADHIIERVNLADKRQDLGGTLAHGEQRYLEIGIALATDPDMLLLDEPTAGMSPEESQQTAQFIQSLANPLTIILVEHDMEIVMGISDKITVLHNGELLAEGTVDEVRANENVQRVYLRD
ncbi:MAG: ABC transporter ATP-binding protein [Nitrospinaceae bacterium]|jgi:branched-chain amino acid transport system ATP-binding protein|nr:ABC transporter ATP-binding protein [Nitrospinaceae bacterium]MBT3432866.1 ABC transporter ATP-binding protein [Nitrospinaceae bacterium]MBT3821266.1 ABC transporter ATP-binding protein [Nitrospinaceae bacterium]MBT4094075.1 ABC transporter ATP-binding protein [Nitrospinaceae bacterium]MBT4432352.1 ABC transporter ATP-binding protein [Nitrospinaceae bacterium]